MATVAEQVRQRVQISIHPWRPREERKPTLLFPAERAVAPSTGGGQQERAVVAAAARSRLLLPSLDRDRPFLVPAPRGHEEWLSSQERRRWPAAAPSSSLPPSTCSVQVHPVLPVLMLARCALQDVQEEKDHWIVQEERGLTFCCSSTLLLDTEFHIPRRA